MFSDILATDNSIKGCFHSGKISVIILVQSIRLFNSRIDCGVVSGNMPLVPAERRMLDTGNPLNARTSIVFQASKDICGGKVCDGSTLFLIACSPDIRKQRRVICLVIWPIAIFYRFVRCISHPASLFAFICAHVGRRNHTVLSCNIGISNASANLVIDNCNTSNDSANSGLNGVDNNLTIKPAIRNS